ncbi:hypothetical protein ACU4GD_08265 [Cupriavidus basilensis]
MLPPLLPPDVARPLARRLAEPCHRQKHRDARVAGGYRWINQGRTAQRRRPSVGGMAAWPVRFVALRPLWCVTFAPFVAGVSDMPVARFVPAAGASAAGVGDLAAGRRLSLWECRRWCATI